MLELAASFTGDTSRNPTVVDMEEKAARYIQIVSLEASSANTAIAEVAVRTRDLFVVEAFSQYENAVNLLR
ncbi:MAG: hypothetical protein HFE86_01335 [Clostridiales bacterium]|nr:hypothetical protein [Clostridiales bacterium]